MPARLSVTIYNSAGERVRLLYEGASQVQGGRYAVSREAAQFGGPGLVVDFGQFLAGGARALVWNADNDAGQPVAGGSYTLKIDETDPFGVVVAWSQPVAVLAPLGPQYLNIYNSAGELVARLDTAASGAGGLISDMDFADPGRAAFAAGAGPGGVQFRLKDAAGSLFSLGWDGRSDAGNRADSGSYLAQLVDTRGRILVSKGFVLLDGPEPAASVLALGPLPLGPRDRSLKLQISGLAAGQPARAGVYNLAGELVASGGLSPAGALTLDASPWASGVYVVVVDIREAGGLDRRLVRRIAVQR